MAQHILSHRLKDWSELQSMDNLLSMIDLSSPYHNFGIHRYNERFWVGGYVGVNRLCGINQLPLKVDGKDFVAIVSSRFNIDEWAMLKKVMTDPEYENYIGELEKQEKFLFKVFYDQPLIRLAEETSAGGELLYAISFINTCYELCQKGLKKSMCRKTENYCGKVRGKVDIKRNIQKNTFKGRNDRFFCTFLDFSEDNIENRILKATLQKCSTILGDSLSFFTETKNRLFFCTRMFEKIPKVKIRTSDFADTDVTGLYTYYKPALQQAKSILRSTCHAFSVQGTEKKSKAVYVIPYVINMETVFEFYARCVLKEQLINTSYELLPYSTKMFTEKRIKTIDFTCRGIHLTPYFIPDIVVKEKGDDNIVAVFDAKYKIHSRVSREDSHQLLTYVLLTGAARCGFMFPGEVTSMKKIRANNTLEINTPILSDLKYMEFILGKTLTYEQVCSLLSISAGVEMSEA